MSQKVRKLEKFCQRSYIMILTDLSKARFPLGEFVRATRSENKNPATWLVKIGWRKNSPRTSRKRSYFFVCSREQIRLVENGLNTIKKLWEKISFHKHFKLRCNVRQDPEAIVTQFIFFYTEAYFPLGELFARTDKKVRTVPTCSRRIFSPANFNQSRCRILVFASRRANKVAKWEKGLSTPNKTECWLFIWRMVGADKPALHAAWLQ